MKNKIIFAMGLGIAAALAAPAMDAQAAENTTPIQDDDHTAYATLGGETHVTSTTTTFVEDESIYTEVPAGTEGAVKLSQTDYTMTTDPTTVVDQEAWDETIHHDAVTHEEQEIVEPAYDETVHHDAVTHEEEVVDQEAWDETIHHEATYKTITVVDKEAYDETIHHEAETHEEEVIDQEAYDEKIPHEATYKTITVVDKEAYDETVHHDAVTHEEEVIDQEAWTETIHHEATYKTITVVDKEAYDETVHHEATYKTITVTDKEAWDETVHHEAITHEELVEEAYDEEIIIEEKSHTETVTDKEAWTENVFEQDSISDRQTSVCRVLENGHIHGDIYAEEYTSASKSYSVEATYKAGTEEWKVKEDYQKATGKNAYYFASEDEAKAYADWIKKYTTGKVNVVTTTNAGGDQDANHNIGSGYTYDAAYWNKVADEIAKKGANEIEANGSSNIYVIEQASDFETTVRSLIASGVIGSGNAGTIEHKNDPTGMDQGKSWISDKCNTVFVYTGTDELTVIGDQGALNMGAIIAPNATVNFNTGEGTALVIADTIKANLQLHINLAAVEMVKNIGKELVIEHEAETHDVKVVDQEAQIVKKHHDAVYETVVDKKAWDEVIHHEAETHEEKVIDKQAYDETVHHEAETHEEEVVDKEAWDEEIPHEATYKTITVVDKDAYDETIHHEAETHEEEVVDQEAWTETVHHEATYKTITVVDKDAYDETIHHEAETHEEEVVDQEAWDEVIHHEATYKTIEVVDEEAFDETIHHDVVFKTITVVDQEAWDEVIHHNARTHDEESIVRQWSVDRWGILQNDDGDVLGERRMPVVAETETQTETPDDGDVLGKRRNPQTGDSASKAPFAGAVAAGLAGIAAFFGLKKKEEEQA